MVLALPDGGSSRPVVRAMAERFGAELRTALEERQMSGYALARALSAYESCGESTVVSWCGGRRSVPLWRIPQMDAALGVRRGHLLRRAGLVEPFDVPTLSIEMVGDRLLVNGLVVPVPAPADERGDVA